LRWK